MRGVFRSVEKELAREKGRAAGPSLLSRRSVVTGTLGVAALFALGGGIDKALAGDDELLRPPGAQDEARFISLCIKCDRCRSICPRSCICIAPLERGIANARTPYLDFEMGLCDFCGLCAQVCPTGAIEAGFDEAADKIGVAVVDQAECLAFNGGGCKKCYEKCRYEAIDWRNSVPIVLPDACNGCGECENICPSSNMRAFTGSGSHRGINVEPERRVIS